MCLVAGLGISPRAQADEDTPSPPTQLKWHARGASVSRAAEPGESPATPRFHAKQAAARQPESQISDKSSRAKLRDSIMQVRGTSDPLSDPFGDNDNAKKEDANTLPPADESTNAPPMPADAESGDRAPAPLRSADPFPDEPIPTPPSYDRSAPDDSSDALGAPGGIGCKGYKSECLRAIADLQSRDMTKIVVGIVIEGVEGQDYPCDCKLGKEVDAPVFQGRNFSATCFTWKASGTCHKPLYFEDVHLERYGHSWNPVLQPFMSAAHFFVSVPLLPYKMGLTPPNECMYTLGYYRPGNCAPYLLDPIPFSLRATVFEAFGAAAFGFWFFPPG